MVVKTSLKILLSLSLLLQTMVFQVSLPNLVLCFGEDGHIAFEWQDNTNHCAHNSSFSYNFLFETKSEITAKVGAGCTDINLHFLPSYADSIKKQNQTLTSAAFMALGDINYLKDAMPFNSNQYRKNPQFNPILDAVKNTILII
ncbi:MAG: hypothetical protein JW956_03615 [Calditrichaceae bacterium]|nr:hypothetical protein [Calditrichaceae bacterium]HES59123.1 hypothetical protein [Caldithrix sp.]